jgi:NitT/TauT family transport system substrate-binding protein
VSPWTGRTNRQILPADRGHDPVKWRGRDGGLTVITVQTRRGFLATAAAAGLLGVPPALADEGPPETTTIRLPRDPTICVAPTQIAEALLRAEGFTDIHYLPPSGFDAVARGEIDFALETAAFVVSQVDAGAPVTALAGAHIGCYELFAHEPIRTISDLKGKRLSIPERVGSSGHMLLAIMAAHVGLDPHKDINWLTNATGNLMERFAEREVDAFLAFPPEPQQGIAGTPSS